LWKKRDSFKWNHTEGSEDDDDAPKVPYRKLLHGRVSVLNVQNSIPPELIKVTMENFGDVTQYLNRSNAHNPMRRVSLQADPSFLVRHGTLNLLKNSPNEESKLFDYKTDRCTFYDIRKRLAQGEIDHAVQPTANLSAAKKPR
jgi:hypothetical protein